ncbi:hypothetical protein NHQ30_007224 [Ciborinia camelliae]|nr:hypothetical protein NHQ30_007224 [Ciborinia camelliae]
MSRRIFSFSPSRLRWLVLLGLSFVDVYGVRGQYFGAVGLDNDGLGLSPRYYLGLEEGRLLGRDSGVCESAIVTVPAPPIPTSATKPSRFPPPQPSPPHVVRAPVPRSLSTNAPLPSEEAVATTTHNASHPGIPGPLVSVIPSGCTTNQIACASSLGGGCCDVGSGCTVLSGTNYCAATTGSSSVIRTGSHGVLATGSSHSPSSHHGLSTGAKAGIAVGVSVIVLASLASFLYIFIRRRRTLSASQGNSSSHPDRDMPLGLGMSQISSPGSRTATSKTGSQGSKRPSPNSGMANGYRNGSDYFGATAQSGPFTEESGSVGTSPGLASSRGVPATPQSPNDIAAPVEIGGEGEGGGWSEGWWEGGWKGGWKGEEGK